MPRQATFGEFFPIYSAGPKTNYIPKTELIAPASAQSAIAASGNWQSGVLTSDGYYNFVIGLTLSQAGTLTLYRYIDDAGTVPLDAGQSQALTANTAAVLVVTDGKPCASYQVKIANSGGSAAAVSSFAGLLSA